ncbi:unnamed protein product [Ophioblennius macclurei]
MTESTESRFAHLLQPIRELTKNWEIDVASELNDYLEELDEMCITFDGGKIRLNFAEAALLIQGSTCIYSKKVELLYSLVYQTLEYINDRNKKRNKKASDMEEDAAGGPAGDDADDMDGFTPVELEESEKSKMAISSAEVCVIPLPPENLIPPETHKKQKLPLISAKGEIICSQMDFRINQFIPQDDIILFTRKPAAFANHLDLPEGDDFQQHQAGVMAEVGGGEPADGEDDAADGFVPLEENHMELDVEEHIDRQQAQSEGRMIRERRQVEAEKPRREAPPVVDVWAFHDPYATIEEDRPFKSDKCYKVPDGLDDGGKRKRRRAAVQDFRSWFTGTFNSSEHKLKNGPTFTDLNYMYVSTLKQRLRTQRRLFRKTGVVISEEELRRTLLQPEEAGPRQDGEEPVEDLLGGDDNSSDVEQGGFPDDIPAEFLGGNDFASAEALADPMSYEDLVKLQVEQLIINSKGYTQETSLSRRVKDWEDKIRPELDLQEQRPVFDIHDYGQRIVDSLNGVGQRKPFSSIVHGLDNFEACKYLLASLQLANDYTVEIDSAVGLEDRLDSMGLTLLSTLRATDRFKTLKAS